MRLEEYSNLDKSTSFCYWLESKTIELGGIGGGSAYKFGIYKRQWDKDDKREAYSTDGEYSWVKKYGNSRETAFEMVRELICRVAEYASDGKFKKIDDIDLGDAYKWKIAFLYSNERLLPIYKKEALQIAAESLGIDKEQSLGA